MAAWLARGGRVGGLCKGGMALGSPWVLRGGERPPAQCGSHPGAGPRGPPAWTWGPRMSGMRPRLPAGLPAPRVASSGWTHMSTARGARLASPRPLTGPSHRPLFVDGAALGEFTQSRVGLTQRCWRAEAPAPGCRSSGRPRLCPVSLGALPARSACPRLAATVSGGATRLPSAPLSCYLPSITRHPSTFHFCSRDPWVPGPPSCPLWEALPDPKSQDEGSRVSVNRRTKGRVTLAWEWPCG